MALVKLESLPIELCDILPITKHEVAKAAVLGLIEVESTNPLRPRYQRLEINQLPFSGTWPEMRDGRRLWFVDETEVEGEEGYDIPVDVFAESLEEALAYVRGKALA